MSENDFCLANGLLDIVSSLSVDSIEYILPPADDEADDPKDELVLGLYIESGLEDGVGMDPRPDLVPP